MHEIIAKRLSLFPLGTRLQPVPGGSALTIAGLDLAALAEEYGTPLYLYDRVSLDAALGDYREALQRHYPGQAGITYAGKAFLCTALAQWVIQQNLWLDCTGAGEIHVAVSSGVPRANILMHGVNKSDQDLDAAVKHAGTLVVDNLTELERLVELHRAGMRPFPDLWLRLKPGMAVATHAYTQTGQRDSKFGMDLEDAPQAVRVCLQAGLPLTGLHFHLGSHFHEPSPLGAALRAVLDFARFSLADAGWFPQVLCTGGGWGVPYHEDDLPHPTVETYVRYLAEQVQALCREWGLPLPRLQVEPGRSLVARAGLALYRVGAVKVTPGRRWLLIDGGLADNPRPALYGARYTALPVRNPERLPDYPTWLAGPFCESGDVLIENLLLPEVSPGEWIAVPVSGAYQLSMGSNYNGARRPAVLWLDEHGAHLIQERETLANLTARDHPLPLFPLPPA
jgi:diaminopimelate decarboxylase